MMCNVATLVFGLATKAKGLQGCGPRGSLGVTSHTRGSVGKCEGVNLHTLGDGVAPLLWPSVGGEAQHLEKLGLGVLRDSRMFKARQQGEKHLALGCSWCHWKGIET